MDVEGENDAKRNADRQFLYIQQLHRLAPLHTAAVRQTDRAIGIGRICGSIHALK